MSKVPQVTCSFHASAHNWNMSVLLQNPTPYQSTSLISLDVILGTYKYSAIYIIQILHTKTVTDINCNKAKNHEQKMSNLRDKILYSLKLELPLWCGPLLDCRCLPELSTYHHHAWQSVPVHRHFQTAGKQFRRKLGRFNDAENTVKCQNRIILLWTQWTLGKSEKRSWCTP